MNYSEAIEYLYSRLPVFHRIGSKALKPGLNNIIRLCKALDNPHQAFRSLHVAGTNGKGSTSHMLASIYQEAGYRVGLYTSPHLKSFTERIRINGAPIAEEDVASFVNQHKSLIETVEPSFFEVTVAMAFSYFAQQAVDLAIIEVGLGGRLDSTNIITPIASVITNIGYDHTDILGETLAEIAAEKAGIIKPGVPVIIGETLPETKPVFARVAAREQSPVFWASDRYRITDKGIKEGRRRVLVRQQQGAPVIEILLDLTGGYQLKNLPAILQTVDVLQAQVEVGAEALRQGLAAVVANTGLKGRFQLLGRNPLIIADTAHNEPGIRELLETINTLPCEQLHIIFGMVADKDRSRILTLLPRNARYYFCNAETPRSLSAADLQKEAAVYELAGREFINVNNAMVNCLQNTNVNDIVLVTGSNYIIAELNSL